MGFTPNVVDGNIILASWGNEIRDRTTQVFATVAERDAQWAAPPNGAVCVTLDTNQRWQRVAGAWQRALVQQAGSAVLATAANGEIVINYPVAFPSTLVTFVASLGFYCGFGLNCGAPPNDIGPLGAKVSIYSMVNGALVPNTTVRVNWYAVGY